MKLSLPTPPPEIAVAQGEQESSLLARLPFEIGLRAFGKSWGMKTEILVSLKTGTPSLYRIAADYGVSHQYVCRLAKRVKGIGTRGVDCR